MSAKERVEPPKCETCNGEGEVPSRCAECLHENYVACSRCGGPWRGCSLCERSVFPLEAVQLGGEPFDPALIRRMLNALPVLTVDVGLGVRKVEGHGSLTLASEQWRATAMPLRGEAVESTLSAEDLIARVGTRRASPGLAPSVPSGQQEGRP